MPSFFSVLVVLFPIVTGALMLPRMPVSYRFRAHLVFGVCLVTSLGVLSLLIWGNEAPFTLIRFSENLTLTFKTDGLGRFFAGIIAALWPLTALYAASYMDHEKHHRAFWGFFTISYGITIGISLSANLFTMYCFYELLTLVTVPLVMQPMTHEAIRAARTYLIYSLGGAAFAFASMMFLICGGADGMFSLGGNAFFLPYAEGSIRLFWLFGIMGFGVKAAIFPLHGWLPKASVAPTPVTALLHAVAVVKAGAFAVIRLTWYCYGTELLAGSWVQTTAILLACATIVYGSARAVREPHWKRRMAYSTVANLSYILLGVFLMTPEGLSAGLIHMAAHACIKILAFFCVGAVMHFTGRTLVSELDGLGRRMPVTFGCFLLSACALTGIPPFSGFISKWYLLSAASASGTLVGWIGCGCLLLSALLTAIYMFSAVRRAWFPDRGHQLAETDTAHEADRRMLIPMVILAAGTLVFGIWTQPIINFVQTLVAGL